MGDMPRYVGVKWELIKIGQTASIRDTHSNFFVTGIPYGSGIITVASNGPLRSVFDSPTKLVVQPPRKLEDLSDCKCALFSYE